MVSVFAIWLLMMPLVGRAEQPTRDFLDVGSVRISYLESGPKDSTDVVVLVHGLHSSAEMNWYMGGRAGSVPALLGNAGFRVVAIDLRGHGESDKPHDEAAYGKEMSEDIARVMDHLKIEKAHIVGYSLGGIVAMRFVIDHPEKTRSLCMGGMGWLKDGSALQKIWERMGREGGKGTPAECVRSIGKMAATAEEIAGVKVPVEMIVGSRDPVKRLYVDALAAARPDWPVVVVEGAGHIQCVMRAEFKEGVAKWVGGKKG